MGVSGVPFFIFGGRVGVPGCPGAVRAAAGDREGAPGDGGGANATAASA